MTGEVHVLFRINFHSEREFTGVFSSPETARIYADRFPEERWEIEPVVVDAP